MEAGGADVAAPGSQHTDFKALEPSTYLSIFAPTSGTPIAAGPGAVQPVFPRRCSRDLTPAFGSHLRPETTSAGDGLPTRSRGQVRDDNVTCVLRISWPT